MRKCTKFLTLLALAIAVPAIGAFAQGPPSEDPVLALDREIIGLDENGFFIPGTTSLQVAVTIFTAEAGTNTISALGLTENIPAGWTYGGLVPSATNPPISPAANAQNSLDFGYIVPPALPTTFTYNLNIPADPTEPVVVSGQVLYRTSAVCPLDEPGCGAGEEIATDPSESEDVVQTEPTIVTITRTIFGDGLTGDNNELYIPGNSITVVLDFEKSGDEAITALGFFEEIPDGVTFGGFEASANNPNVGNPPMNNTGVLSFGWIVPPAFPFTLTYTLNLDPALFGPIEFLGIGEYRLGGPAIFTEPFDVALAELPCVVLTREVAGGFTPGENVAITVTIDSNCNDPLAALGLNEQIPAGWTYVGVSGANAPPITPNANAQNSLDFGFIVVPALPATFTYTLAVPAEEEATEAEISGIVEYRLDNPNNSGAQFSLEVVTIVSGIDETPPVITLLGDNPLTLECGDEFVEPGFEAIDDRDGDITANVVVTGSVDAGNAGSYELTYTVSDEAGNEASEVRVVNVVDTTAPVITLIGPANQTIQCGSPYTDAGASAADACDGNITGNIVVVNPVNTAVPGDYTVTYNVSDSAGNAAAEVTRTVTVEDTTAPTLNILGANPLTIQCGATYTDPGATANDVCAGAVSVTIDSSAVNTAVVGSYTVTFTADDGNGNVANGSRTVNVVDTTAPVVTLNGASVVTVECSEVYSDLGATANDSCDGDLTGSISVDNPVNAGVTGSYTVTYSVTDAAGNEGTATRTVNVVDTTAPVITLNGGDVTLECGETYTDAGATATDSCDGNLTGSISVDNPVNAGVAGTYTVTYTVSDAAGNEATATRTVTVEDTTAPTISLSGSAVVNVECGAAYEDAGATASDSCEGDISGSIVVDNPVDTATPGTYTVTYNVSDGAGNSADEVSRTVIVEDTTAPVITLNGAAALTLECGEAYTEAGATAADACDGAVEVEIVGAVDTSTAGEYVLTYRAVDAAGNEADEVTRSVTVEDTVAPVITLEGSDPATIDCGEDYVDAGVTAIDACDGEVTVNVDASDVNNAEPGTYTVVYTATDSAGNSAEAFRTVIVDGPGCEEGEGEGGEGEGEGAEECVDTAGNGYADNPFECLGESQVWNAQVQSVSCDRSVQMVSWFDGGNGTIGASVINPDNPAQVITVTVPRNLIGPGEQAVLILAVSCDVVSLLSPEDASDLTDNFPAGALNGSPSIEVSLIVSSDGGATFSEIEDLTASSTASTITITGLNFTPGLVPTLLSHPTLVDSDESGIIITGTVGEWGGLGVTNVQRFGSTLVADLLSLSTFEVFEVNPVGPTLSVRPDPRFDFIVGIVRLGDSVDNVITLRNVGTGTVNGTATLNDPNGVFSIVGASNYSLTGDQSRLITVRFTPTAMQDYTATLTLTGGDGGPIQVTLKGSGSIAVKPTIFFGCGPAQGAAGGMGFADLAVLLLALGAMVAGTRMVRSRQNG